MSGEFVNVGSDEYRTCSTATVAAMQAVGVFESNRMGFRKKAIDGPREFPFQGHQRL
jgi:hypothetical protein